MSDARQRRNTWLIRAGFLLFLAALFLWPEVRRMISAPASSSASAPPQATCYATTVALHQHLFDAYGDDPSTGFAEFDALQLMLDDMTAWTRGLRRRDDPLAHRLRPIVARAGERRDTFVARDAALYRAEAWSEVRDCHSLHYGSGE